MLVKTFLEYMPHGPIDSWCALWAEALQLKLEAWQQEQTNAFECTMTREQYGQLFVQRLWNIIHTFVKLC